MVKSVINVTSDKIFVGEWEDWMKFDSRVNLK